MLTGVRAVLHRAAPVAKDQAGARFASTQAGAVDELAGLGILANERAHVGDELHRRRLARLGLRIVLVHDHEAHCSIPSERLRKEMRAAVSCANSRRSKG